MRRRIVEQVSLALVNKGKALGRMGRAEEAHRQCWDDVVRRFGADDGEGHPLAVATALAEQGRNAEQPGPPRGSAWRPGRRSRDASAGAGCTGASRRWWPTRCSGWGSR